MRMRAERNREWEWHTGSPPEEQRWYLVTMAAGDARTVTMKQWTRRFGEWRWGNLEITWTVTAWTELPDPYEGDKA